MGFLPYYQKKSLTSLQMLSSTVAYSKLQMLLLVLHPFEAHLFQITATNRESDKDFAILNY